MAQVKRYFELAEGSSTRFWEVWIDGVEVRTRHGRIGSGGQAQVEGLATPQDVPEQQRGFAGVDPAARIAQAGRNTVFAINRHWLSIASV